MPRVRIRIRSTGTTAPQPAGQPDFAENNEGPSIGKLAVGAIGLGVAGVIARKPSLIGKALNAANSARQQIMLSGLAVPKSVLGNTGAAFIESAEKRSMAPIKSFFSRQTLRDAAATYKANVPYPGATRIPGPNPGRIMNAMDQATQKALVRSGVMHDQAVVQKAVQRGTPLQQAIQESAETEAERAVLQAPLNGDLGKAMDSPAARYLIPFRRTPFNQFIEGLKTIKPENIAANPALSAGVAGAGTAHGAATSEDRYPLSLGLGTAVAGRYALPYSLAALLGRTLAGGRTDAGIAGAVLPVSEYGLTTGIEDPLQPFTNPAALTALRRIIGED